MTDSSVVCVKFSLCFCKEAESLKNVKCHFLSLLIVAAVRVTCAVYFCPCFFSTPQAFARSKGEQEKSGSGSLLLPEPLARGRVLSSAVVGAVTKIIVLASSLLWGYWGQAGQIVLVQMPLPATLSYVLKTPCQTFPREAYDHFVARKHQERCFALCPPTLCFLFLTCGWQLIIRLLYRSSSVAIAR